MFDIAWSEFMLIGAVALVVIGPKDLPKAMRVVGYWVGKIRGVARQFRSGFDDMVREAEFAEMEKKWAEENARIMREFPSADTPPAPALPPPVPTPAANEAVEAPVDPEPAMTVEPMLFDDPVAPVPEAAPPPAKPKRKRKAAQEPSK